MRATLAVSGILFVFAIVYWLGADALPRSPLAGHVGADGLPKLLAVTLAVLSICLAVQTYMDMRKQRRSGAAVRQAEAAEDDEAPASHLRAFGLIGIGAAYLLLLPFLGYALSAALVLGVVATYSGLKPSLKTLYFAIGGGAVCYVIFVKILQIPLPAGFWPSLFS
ncbi:tripartite tricarboxylate transporter TctB family protein [Pseudochelatococcus sp. B33]